MSTPVYMVPATAFPTRFEAFERQGVWCLLDLNDASPEVHYSEAAVYSNRAADLYADVSRAAGSRKPERWVAEIVRGNHGETFVAPSFVAAFDWANERMGLS